MPLSLYLSHLGSGLPAEAGAFARACPELCSRSRSAGSRRIALPRPPRADGAEPDQALLAFFIIAHGLSRRARAHRPAPAYLSYRSTSRCRSAACSGGLFAGSARRRTCFRGSPNIRTLMALAALCRPCDAAATERRSGSGSQRPAPGALVVFAFLPANGIGRQRCASSTWRCSPSPRCRCCSRAMPAKSAVIVVLALIVAHTQHTGADIDPRSFSASTLSSTTYDKRFRILQRYWLDHSRGRGARRRQASMLGGQNRSPTTMTAGRSRRRSRSVAGLRKLPAPLRVAVIGLGAGALASPHHAERDLGGSSRSIRPRSTSRAIRKYFTFVSTCAPGLPVVLGDARLTMAAEPAGFYDVIVVDAYSSDAVPVHLATRGRPWRSTNRGLRRMASSSCTFRTAISSWKASRPALRLRMGCKPGSGTTPNSARTSSGTYISIVTSPWPRRRAEDVGTIATSGAGH